MSAGPPRSTSVRAILLLLAAAAGLYVAALGAYAVLQLRPAAMDLHERAGELAREYDSLRVRTATLESAVRQLRRLSAGPRLSADDSRQLQDLQRLVTAVSAQAAGLQASLVLRTIPPDMRVALAEAAGVESQLAGVLLEAMADLGQGDRASATRWIARADSPRELLLARVGEAQGLGLEDLSDREDRLGLRATQVARVVVVWLVLGSALVGLATLVLRRRLFAPLTMLDRGLAQVAQGDLGTSLHVLRSDELGRLTEHFNQMTSVLRARPEVEALRQSEVRFRSLIEHGMDLISIIGADARFRYSSPTVTRLLGYGQLELIGRLGFDYVHPDDLPRVRAAFTRALAGAAGEIREEFRFRHRDGSWRHFESVVTNLVDEPTVAGLVINSRDVTERRRAEETLRRERFLVDTLMEHLPDSIYFKDADSRFLRINRAMAERLGLGDPAQAAGRTDFDFFAQDHAEAARRDEEEIIRTGRPVTNLEEQETWPDRPSTWVSTTKMPLRDAAGRVVGTFGVSRDITERKVTELALARSQASLARIFQVAPVAISLSDLADGRILDVNEEFVKTLGYSRDDLLGRTSLEIGLWVDPEDRNALRRIAAEHGEAKNRESRLRTKDGLIREVRGNYQATDIGGRAVVLATFIDITERKEAERALRGSEARFRTAFMTVADAHYIATRDEGRILEVNDHFETVFGYRREEAVGHTSLELDLYADPEDRKRMLAELRAKGQVRELEVVARRKGGALIPVRISVSDLTMGEQPLILGVVRDVSEQKRADDALRTLEEQFRQAQRLEAVGRLAGGVAHDFNNILTAISGYTELLLEDIRGTDPRRADLEEIRTATQRATALTRQLLAFSRKQVLQPRVLDLNEVVQGLEKMLRRLIGEDVDLAITPAAGLGAVRADPGQIEQVILNLAVNARDAMPEGGRLTIETANVELDSTYAGAHADAVAGPHVLLAVSDTGSGMSPEVQSHIFEPFFTTKELGKGTGLGLATVHGIVAQSGGRIRVYSEPGLGTSFKIFLPRVDRAGVTLEPAPAAPSAEGGHETVLIAEDDAAVREVVAKALAHRGYTVLRASDGRAALELARTHAGGVDLLLTDIVMPGITGRELAQTLAVEHPRLRVLYMSGYTDDAVVRRGVLEEGMPFLQKPFTSDALALRVREVLDRK